MNGRGPLVALAGYLVFLISHRGFELVVSARNERVLRARGAYQVGHSHFLLFVLLHTAYPAALIAEVVVLGTRPGRLWPLWASLVAAALALRIAAHQALGGRWTARIWVVPGMAPVTGGIYRWLRHPSYAGITIELAAGALLFGAWRTALLASGLNLIALAVRIPLEERALAEATARR